MERCVELYCTETAEWIQPLTTQTELAYRETEEFQRRLAMWPEDMRAGAVADVVVHLCTTHLPLYRGAMDADEADLQDSYPYDRSELCSLPGCLAHHTQFVGVLETDEDGEERVAGSPVCDEHVDYTRALILAEDPEAVIRIEAREGSTKLKE